MADKYLQTCIRCGKHFHNKDVYAAHVKDCKVDRSPDAALAKYRQAPAKSKAK